MVVASFLIFFHIYNFRKPFTKLEEQENVDETHSTCSGSYDQKPSKNGLLASANPIVMMTKNRAPEIRASNFPILRLFQVAKRDSNSSTVDDNQKNNERKSVFHRPFLESEVSEPCSEDRFHDIKYNI